MVQTSGAWHNGSGKSDKEWWATDGGWPSWGPWDSKSSKLSKHSKLSKVDSWGWGGKYHDDTRWGGDSKSGKRRRRR